MKVLLLSPSYPRTETDTRVPFVRAFVKELVKEKGIKVTIITSSAPDTKDFFQIMDNAKIYRFNYFLPQRLQNLSYTKSSGILESYRSSFLAKIQVPFFLLSFFLKARKHAKDCDIVDAQWLLSGLIGIWLKKLYKKPIVCVVRGADLRSMPTWLRKYIIKRIDTFISWTPELTNLLKSLGRTKDVFDIKQMIDFEKLDSNKGVKEFKKEFHLDNKFVVTFLGRLCYMKNPLGFIKAIPYVIEKDKDVIFMMVGDGELMEEAKSLIKKQGIENYVYLTGARSDVNALLKNTSVFVGLSPICHTFSATIMESMYLGVPCILDQPIYTKEYFTHKRYAYLVPNNNPKALAEAILLLKKDKKLYNTLSRNGPGFVKNIGFEKKKIISGTIGLYKRMINQNK